MKRLIIFICIFSLSSCALFGEYRHRHIHTTSLVKYLYPQGKLPLEDKRNPVLNLPLRVGLAFIPDTSRKQVISPVLKNTLLESVKTGFEGKEYVDEIIVIPELYLQNTQGYSGLQQIKTLYQLDIIALVSYDQIVNTKENIMALSYLTIVGAYIFPGTGYQVNTMLDLAVVDVDSKSLLFRAAGSSSSKSKKVADAYRNQAFNKKQNKEFEIAMLQMQGNLVLALDKFEHRMRSRDESEPIKVNYRKGYSGGGSIPLPLLAILLTIAMGIYVKRRS